MHHVVDHKAIPGGQDSGDGCRRPWSIQQCAGLRDQRSVRLRGGRAIQANVGCEAEVRGVAGDGRADKLFVDYRHCLY